MAFRITRALEIVSWLTQIASYLGLPIAVVGGAIAGFFAWTKDLGPLLTSLIIIFVFTSVLQSLMAATFLIDRIFERRRQTEEENRAIAYQLAPVGAAIVRDDGNESDMKSSTTAFASWRGARATASGCSPATAGIYDLNFAYSDYITWCAYSLERCLRFFER